MMATDHRDQPSRHSEWFDFADDKQRKSLLPFNWPTSLVLTKLFPQWIQDLKLDSSENPAATPRATTNQVGHF